jgi:hypothetical protein
MRVQVIAVAAAGLPVALLKISMIGNPVVELSAVVISPIQKRIASKNANPIMPLTASDPSIHHGTETAGFIISSQRWIAPSYPFVTTSADV